jgi:1,4-dihydroxy-2-naphthoate polyprenyltransferase
VRAGAELSVDRMLAAALVATALHIAGVLFIDTLDHSAGTDKLARLDRSGIPTGGLALEEGQVSVSQLRIAALSLVIVAALGLAYIGSQPAWILAGVALLLTSQYAGPPLRLAYIGGGELILFACYGPLAALGAYSAQTPWSVIEGFWWASCSVGILIAMAYASHHFLHWRADKAATKQTIVVSAGERGAILVVAAADLLALGCFVMIGLSGWGSAGLWFGLLAVPALAHALHRAWVDPLPQAFLKLIGAHLSAAAISTIVIATVFSTTPAV